jgi:uncharacterized membrane protein YuzA (DUF378 family)
MNIFQADPNTMVYMKWFHILVIGLVLLGALNWLTIGTMGVDIPRYFLAPRYAKWVYITIGVAALFLIFRRDMYLPFLGETVLPGGALTVKTPQNANDQVTIRTVPKAKVVYWAAEPNPTQGKDVPNWERAYSEFDNSGVAEADEQGNAILRFRGPPQSYTVPLMGKLSPHVHFRICDAHGITGPVQSLFIKDGVIENFANIV